MERLSQNRRTDSSEGLFPIPWWGRSSGAPVIHVLYCTFNTMDFLMQYNWLVVIIMNDIQSCFKIVHLFQHFLFMQFHNFFSTLKYLPFSSTWVDDWHVVFKLSNDVSNVFCVITEVIFFSWLDFFVRFSRQIDGTQQSLLSGVD